MSKPLAEPLHVLAMSGTMEVLSATIAEALKYLYQDEHRCVLGTLLLFEDQVADVNAAIRLFRRDIQNGRKS
jgi:hypothetical protein